MLPSHFRQAFLHRRHRRLDVHPRCGSYEWSVLCYVHLCCESYTVDICCRSCEKETETSIWRCCDVHVETLGLEPLLAGVESRRAPCAGSCALAELMAALLTFEFLDALLIFLGRKLCVRITSTPTPCQPAHMRACGTTPPPAMGCRG